MGNDTGMVVRIAQRSSEVTHSPTYFLLQEHRSMIYGHVALMMIAWVLILPIAVMLSLARLRYTLLIQGIFFATNAVGLLLGMIYNTRTPDLYPDNVHHPLGWVLTWVVLVQICIGQLSPGPRRFRSAATRAQHSTEMQGFLSGSTHSHVQRGRGDNSQAQVSKLSNDSGQSSEPDTESCRRNLMSSDPLSPISFCQNEEEKEYDSDREHDYHKALTFPSTFRHAWHGLRIMLHKRLPSRVRKVLLSTYNLINGTILIFGFIALCTGIITYGGLFQGKRIFNGLAHWIKGGAFFWLGIFTLGRWAGCFGELAWAWNMRPKSEERKGTPSAEFVESALIFFYGASNVFLEHLARWGAEWSAQDLEHVSIAILFLGGGLTGMLIESRTIRSLLNTKFTSSTHHPADRNPDHIPLASPDQYSVPINPIPALVILLLGIMMSSHTQGTMTSTMIHKQWGQLLAGAAFARAGTYVLLWLRPPKSVLPSRPPTELLVAFGLIAGGVVFMASSSDTVDTMVHYGLDAMFVYTVTMGFVGLLMAWVIALLALKGWATRKEACRAMWFN